MHTSSAHPFVWPQWRTRPRTEPYSKTIRAALLGTMPLARRAALTFALCLVVPTLLLPVGLMVAALLPAWCLVAPLLLVAHLSDSGRSSRAHRPTTPPPAQRQAQADPWLDSAVVQIARPSYEPCRLAAA